jgi:DNA-binding MarR family transcriptional regulator
MMNSTVPAGCWDLDLQTGMLALCARSRTMFGVSPRSSDRLTESEWASRFYPDDLGRVRQALTASLDRQVPYAQRFRIVQPDGSLQLVVGIGRPLESGGTFTRFVGWNFDVVSSGEMAVDWILAHPEALNSEPRLSESTLIGSPDDESSSELPSDALFQRAQSILRVRQARERLLGRAAIGDPAFDLLLCLYLRSGQTATSLTDLARSANTPYSSAMRWIRYLGDKGLVERMESRSDRRSTLVHLTRTGRAVLDELFALR